MARHLDVNATVIDSILSRKSELFYSSLALFNKTKRSVEFPPVKKLCLENWTVPEKCCPNSSTAYSREDRRLPSLLYAVYTVKLLFIIISLEAFIYGSLETSHMSREKQDVQK